MISWFGTLVLLGTFQAAPDTQILVDTRDPVVLDNVKESYSGFCDRKLIKANLVKSYKRFRGSFFVTYGTKTVVIPDSFLLGKLFGHGLHSIGLACDGEKLLIVGHAFEIVDGKSVNITSQTASVRLVDGKVTLTSPQGLQ